MNLKKKQIELDVVTDDILIFKCHFMSFSQLIRIGIEGEQSRFVQVQAVVKFENYYE